MSTATEHPYPGSPPLVHAVGAERDAYVRGLEDLAAWLKANPGVQVSRWGTQIMFSPRDGLAGVQRHARMLGVPVDGRGHACRAVKSFGPISYVAYAAKGDEAA